MKLNIAVAIDVNNKREVSFVYPIVSAKKVRRKDITRKQSGSDDIKKPEELYWLFELGKALSLNRKTILDMETSFKLKFLSIEDLSSGLDWNELSERYSTLYKLVDKN